MQLTTVQFHGDTLIGVRNDAGEVVIPLKPICDAVGLLWHGQLARIKRHPVLAKGIHMTCIPLGSGGPQEAVCLPLDKVNFWLATIDVRRIREPQLRERVVLYQEECADVLYRHFQGGGADPASRAPARRVDHSLTPDEIVRAAAEIRHSRGPDASASFLLEHAAELTIGQQTAEYLRCGSRQGSLRFT